MSDDAYFPDLTPLTSAVKARNLARHYKGFAEGLRRDGFQREATIAERESGWWLAYSIALAAIPPGRIDMDP